MLICSDSLIRSILGFIGSSENTSWHLVTSNEKNYYAESPEMHVPD